MDPAFENGEEALLAASNLQLSEDDNVLVQGVEGDKYAIGYFGFAYFVENEGKLLVVIIPSSGERYLSTWLFETPDKGGAW